MVLSSPRLAWLCNDPKPLDANILWETFILFSFCSSQATMGADSPGLPWYKPHFPAFWVEKGPVPMNHYNKPINQDHRETCSQMLTYTAHFKFNSLAMLINSKEKFNYVRCLNSTQTWLWRKKTHLHGIGNNAQVKILVFTWTRVLFP